MLIELYGTGNTPHWVNFQVLLDGTLVRTLTLTYNQSIDLQKTLSEATEFKGHKIVRSGAWPK